MANRNRHKALRAAIVEMLKSGEIIKPEEIATDFELTVADTAARTLWIRTLVGRMVHDEARAMGLIALSCGPGLGFKAVTSSEDADLARARTRAQIKGQATRGRRLLDKLQLLNQYTFDFQEVMCDASDDTTQPAAVASS